MTRVWMSNTIVAVMLALAACGTLPPSPVATEAFQKRYHGLHIDLFWNCEPVEAGGLLIAGVVQVWDTALPILNLWFAATAYDTDGRRLTRVVGFPDGLHIGYENWTRFRVLVPRGQGAARVDLGHTYYLPSQDSDTPRRSDRLLFQFVGTEEFFWTVQDACRS